MGQAVKGGLPEESCFILVPSAITSNSKVFVDLCCVCHTELYIIVAEVQPELETHADKAALHASSAT